MMRKHSRYDAPDRGKRLSRGHPIPSSNSLSKQPYISNIYNGNRTNPVRTFNRSPNQTVISTILTCTCLFIIFIARPSHQQHNTQLCPKVCTCDNQNLEVVCKGPFDANGLPHTLNPSTKRITVNHAQTTQLTSSDLEYFRSLEALDLANNRLSIIDFDHIKFNVNLNYLNASHNSIIELKDSAVSMVLGKSSSSVSNLTSIIESDDYKKLKKSKIHVVELNVSHNQLTVLKDFTFLRWHRLQKLDISYNLIEILENDSLFGLSKLEHLILRGNRITSIPARPIHSTARSLSYTGTTEETISALKVLDLSENPLISIESNSFSSLGNVRDIYLESCLIRTIDPQAFRGLSSITTLSLTNNDLAEVPSEAFSALTTLKVLKLNSNDIHFLRPFAFNHLFSLEELHMTNGSLLEVGPNALSGAPLLKILLLDYNLNLTKVDSSIFEDLPNLTHLSIQMGSLRTLATDENINKHRTMLVDLRGNSLVCDCDLKWLTNSLKRLNETVIPNRAAQATGSYSDNHFIISTSDFANIDQIMNLTCAGPSALAGKKVISLPNNKLECLKPSSNLNVHIGFGSLFFLILVLVTVCLVNFCRNEKHLFGILKENIVQNRISMMFPYNHEVNKNTENFNKKTQIECAEYEPIDYGQDYGPIYTLPGDRYMNGSSDMQHTHHL